MVSDSRRGLLYVADTGNDRVLAIARDGTIRALASLNVSAPTGLAMDGAGRLYITDTGNHRVLMFDEYYVAVVAGDGRAGFSGDYGPGAAAQLNTPEAVTIDGSGNMYIADSGNR